MKMRSREAMCHSSSSSPRRMRSSVPSRCLVRSALRRKISLTPMKCGFSSEMTHELGDMETSQSVKA